jgi:AcrR family transcriptional regulator
MARRSDHSREALEELILSHAHALMAETGLQRFSAREVAKRIGYSVGTLYNVFGSLDRLLLAVNSRTFLVWASEIADRLDAAGPARTGSRSWSTPISTSPRPMPICGPRSSSIACRPAKRCRRNSTTSAAS